MRNQMKDAMEMAARRQKILETGFKLFSQKTIPAVTMNSVADACGIGVATLYRYYRTKPALVLAIATWLWEDYAKETIQIVHETEKNFRCTADRYAFFIDTFIDLFRNHKEMLRFNQLFNIYVRSEKIPPSMMKSYTAMIDAMSSRFKEAIMKGKEDGTIRSDVTEQALFSTTLHLMLATTTRYAFGLVYTPEGGVEAERELHLLKRMLLSEFTTKAECNFSAQMVEKPPKKAG